MLASHKKLHKETEEQSQRNENDPPPPQQPRRRPQRIAARRQRESLCAFQFQELEWADMDDVDTEGLERDLVVKLIEGGRGVEIFVT